MISARRQTDMHGGRLHLSQCSLYNCRRLRPRYHVSSGADRLRADREVGGQASRTARQIPVCTVSNQVTRESKSAGMSSAEIVKSCCVEDGDTRPDSPFTKQPQRSWGAVLQKGPGA